MSNISVLQTVEISGPQSSTDPNWNAARVTYWGGSDVVAGNGTQRGYYLNERADGSRDWGTFEGKVSTNQGGTVIDGTWRVSEGTGKFVGVVGQGTYKTRMTSPTELECTWKGVMSLLPPPEPPDQEHIPNRKARSPRLFPPSNPTQNPQPELTTSS